MDQLFFALVLVVSASVGGIVYFGKRQATLGLMFQTARLCGLKRTRSLPGSGRPGYTGTWNGHGLTLEQTSMESDAEPVSLVTLNGKNYVSVLTLSLRLDDPRLKILARLGSNPESQLERSVVRLNGQPGEARFAYNGWKDVEHTHQLRALLNNEAWMELRSLLTHAWMRRLRFEDGCICIDMEESRFRSPQDILRLLQRMTGFMALLGDTRNLVASLTANYHRATNPQCKLWYLDSLHGMSISAPDLVPDPEIVRNAKSHKFFPLRFKALQMSPDQEQDVLVDLLFRVEAKYQCEILDYLTRTGRVEFLPQILSRQRGVLAQARFRLIPFLLLKPDAQAEKFLLDELTDDIPDDTDWVYACLDALAKIGTLNAVPVLHRYRRLGSGRETDAAVKAIQARYSGGAEGWVSIASEAPRHEGALSLPGREARDGTGQESGDAVVPGTGCSRGETTSGDGASS